MTDAQRPTAVTAVADNLATALGTAVDYEARLLMVEKLTHALADIAVTAGDAAALPAVPALKADLPPVAQNLRANPRPTQEVG